MPSAYVYNSVDITFSSNFNGKVVSVNRDISDPVGALRRESRMEHSSPYLTSCTMAVSLHSHAPQAMNRLVVTTC